MRHKFTILIGYITQYIDYLPREDDQKNPVVHCQVFITITIVPLTVLYRLCVKNNTCLISSPKCQEELTAVCVKII